MLTIDRFPVLVPLGSANFAKRGEDVINALCELVGDVEDRAADNGSTFNSSQVRIGQIILVDDRIPPPGRSNAHDFSGVRAREQNVSEMGSRTTDDPDRSNDNTVEDCATDDVAFVDRSPSGKWVRSCRRGGVGDNGITVIAVNPGSGGFDVRELRGVGRANRCYGIGYQVEQFDRAIGTKGRGDIDDCFNISQQVFPLVYICGLADDRYDCRLMVSTGNEG